MTKKIVIIAGSYPQFKEYLHVNRVPLIEWDRYIYASDPTHLRGRNFDNTEMVLLVGSYQYNPTYGSPAYKTLMAEMSSVVSVKEGQLS